MCEGAFCKKNSTPLDIFLHLIWNIITTAVSKIQVTCDEWAFLQNKSLFNQLIHQAMMSYWWLTYGVCRTLQRQQKQSHCHSFAYSCLSPKCNKNQQDTVWLSRLHTRQFSGSLSPTIGCLCGLIWDLSQHVICPNNSQVCGVNALVFFLFFVFYCSKLSGSLPIWNRNGNRRQQCSKWELAI